MVASSTGRVSASWFQREGVVAKTALAQVRRFSISHSYFNF
jgi:hypothetical protein